MVSVSNVNKHVCESDQNERSSHVAKTLMNVYKKANV